MSRPLHFLVLPLLIVGSGVCLATGYRAPQIPAREILQAIDRLEEAQAHQIRQLETETQISPRGLPAVFVPGSAVQWEPEAAPESVRSWMMFNLDEDTWRRLRQNVDQKGQPLL